MAAGEELEEREGERSEGKEGVSGHSRSPGGEPKPPLSRSDCFPLQDIQPTPFPISSLSAQFTVRVIRWICRQTETHKKEGNPWQTGSPFLNDLRGESFSTVVSVSMETDGNRILAENGEGEGMSRGM